MTNLRELTQEDVDQMFEDEIKTKFLWFPKGSHTDMDIIATRVLRLIDKMRHKDVIDEVYDLEGMIEEAKARYADELEEFEYWTD